MKAMLLSFLCLMMMPLQAQVDVNKLGESADRTLRGTNTIEHCLKTGKYDVRHLLLVHEQSYRQFVRNAGKFRHIDSLTIGGSVICAIVNQLESGMFENGASALPELPDLEYLKVSVFTMEDMFTNLAQFKKLKFLELTGPYEKIPDDVWTLESLEYLDLTGSFSEVPTSINNLKNLKELTLMGEYDDLPTAPTFAKKLLHLNLSGKFKTSPAIIANCPNLLQLKLSSHIPIRITDNIGIPKKLRILDLSYSHILSVSDAIGNLKELRELYFSCSWLTELPEAICELTNLEELWLDVMCLEEEIEDHYGGDFHKIPVLPLPKNMHRLENLEWLDLTSRKTTKEDLARMIALFSDDNVDYEEW